MENKQEESKPESPELSPKYKGSDQEKSLFCPVKVYDGRRFQHFNWLMRFLCSSDNDCWTVVHLPAQTTYWANILEQIKPQLGLTEADCKAASFVPQEQGNEMSASHLAFGNIIRHNSEVFSDIFQSEEVTFQCHGLNVVMYYKYVPVHHIVISNH
jgi:hypothetical protein